MRHFSFKMNGLQSKRRRDRTMKAMWMAFAAIIIIAAGAGVVLNNVEFSSADRYSTPNVRVD